MKASFLKKKQKEIIKADSAVIVLKSGKEIKLYPTVDEMDGYLYIVNEEDNVYEVNTIENTFYVDCDEISMIVF